MGDPIQLAVFYDLARIINVACMHQCPSAIRGEQVIQESHLPSVPNTGARNGIVHRIPRTPRYQPVEGSNSHFDMGVADPEHFCTDPGLLRANIAARNRFFFSGLSLPFALLVAPWTENWSFRGVRFAPRIWF